VVVIQWWRWRIIVGWTDMDGMVEVVGSNKKALPVAFSLARRSSIQDKSATNLLLKPSTYCNIKRTLQPRKQGVVTSIGFGIKGVSHRQQQLSRIKNQGSDLYYF